MRDLRFLFAMNGVVEAVRNTVKAVLAARRAVRS